MTVQCPKCNRTIFSKQALSFHEPTCDGSGIIKTKKKTLAAQSSEDIQSIEPSAPLVLKTDDYKKMTSNFDAEIEKMLNWKMKMSFIKSMDNSNQPPQNQNTDLLEFVKVFNKGDNDSSLNQLNQMRALQKSMRDEIMAEMPSGDSGSEMSDIAQAFQFMTAGMKSGQQPQQPLNNAQTEKKMKENNIELNDEDLADLYEQCKDMLPPFASKLKIETIKKFAKQRIEEHMGFYLTEDTYVRLAKLIKESGKHGKQKNKQSQDK